MPPLYQALYGCFADNMKLKSVKAGLSSLCYRWGKWGLEKLHGLPKVTQLVQWQTSDSNPQSFDPKAYAPDHFTLSLSHSLYLPASFGASSLPTRLDLPSRGSCLISLLLLDAGYGTTDLILRPSLGSQLMATGLRLWFSSNFPLELEQVKQLIQGYKNKWEIWDRDPRIVLSWRSYYH